MTTDPIHNSSSNPPDHDLEPWVAGLPTPPLPEHARRRIVASLTAAEAAPAPELMTPGPLRRAVPLWLAAALAVASGLAGYAARPAARSGPFAPAAPAAAPPIVLVETDRLATHKEGDRAPGSKAWVVLSVSTHRIQE